MIVIQDGSMLAALIAGAESKMVEAKIAKILVDANRDEQDALAMLARLTQVFEDVLHRKGHNKGR